MSEYLLIGYDVLLGKIAIEYISTSKQKRIYEQIRFSDISGMEKVRVNENQGLPVRATAEELQFQKQ
ncbi:hypothetical protein [Desulfotalea psychrophila]|uniref:hypothetical protein n=1 Tax=Desulfotalea psychrophila TaxID=84980 RepID=UPI0012EAEAAA|nr:hypothetical protein [Desulfotalea psychrophila]